ncbi:hypothetical protein M1I95_00320 [Rossellomorea marisflavi]|uniref:hypothetical protein n=1 Tax=Rossellomorea marisflavi TaxID=189381 RepID=UPI0027A702C6|nr:hypothetical protein [Rossellomorea marisflavi]UTE73024.1 hypothetical protein M1I95_00320 [Rossellomorea marisflavi]
MVSTWSLSYKELYLLNQLLEGNEWIGINDPYIGYTDEEMKDEWKQALRDLSNRGLVKMTDDELIFEDEFIHAVWIIAKSNLIAEIETDFVEQSQFFFGDDKVIECMKETEERVTVYAHPTHELAFNQVIYPRLLMGVEHLEPRLDDSFHIRTSEYEDYCAQGMINDKDRLKEETGSSLMIDQFNRAIQRRRHTNRLMVFYKQESSWNIEGVHLLSSPSYNWALRMVTRDGAEWLQVKQVAGMDLLNEIGGAFNRVKGKQTVH